MPAQKTGPRKRAPIHPGHLVGSSLETLGLSARAAARRLNVTPMEIRNLIAAKSPITPEMALRLGALFGNGPELWLSMQQDYDLWYARIDMKVELANIRLAPKD